MHSQNKILDFSSQIFFLGIDVHKKNWAVTIRTNQMELKTISMNAEPKELRHYMDRHYPGAIIKSVYESGFSGYWIHRHLESLGIKNIVVNAADVPTSNKEKVNKTDPVDSRKLARELENNTLRGIYIPDIFNQELRSLCRQRYQTLKDQTRLKNRIKSYLHFYGHRLPENKEFKHWSKSFIEQLRTLSFSYQIGKDELNTYIEQLYQTRQSLLRLTAQIRKYIRESGRQSELELLLSLPGIGYTTASTILTEIMDIKRFSRFDQLASFVGFVPSVSSSGDKQLLRGMSQRYSRYLRSLLIESAWVAVRSDPALTYCYDELKKRMSGKQAIVRIAKKLLSRLYYVWKNRVKYTYSLVR